MYFSQALPINDYAEKIEPNTHTLHQVKAMSKQTESDVSHTNKFSLPQNHLYCLIIYRLKPILELTA